MCQRGTEAPAALLSPVQEITFTSCLGPLPATLKAASAVDVYQVAALETNGSWRQFLAMQQKEVLGSFGVEPLKP